MRHRSSWCASLKYFCRSGRGPSAHRPQLRNARCGVGIGERARRDQAGLVSWEIFLRPLRASRFHHRGRQISGFNRVRLPDKFVFAAPCGSRCHWRKHGFAHVPLVARVCGGRVLSRFAQRWRASRLAYPDAVQSIACRFDWGEQFLVKEQQRKLSRVSAKRIV